MDQNQSNNSYLLEELSYGKFFAGRMGGIPRSFIREILKVASRNDIISFAGGLPNRDLFPVQKLSEAARKVFLEDGKDILQYSNSEGYLPLREYIADRYRRKQGINVSPEQILITSGSQQGLDLIGKVLINKGDRVVMEKPGYLGAIQAFSVYQPEFVPVKMNPDGIDASLMQKEATSGNIKLLYSVPDFQNPSGISYSEDTRQQVAQLAEQNDFLIAEDTPYSELRFSGKSKDSLYKLNPERTILLGTFSKTVVPSFRTGWMVAPKEIFEKLLIAKQASDLHTNYFTQRVLHRFLAENSIDNHIAKIIRVYGRQRNKMLDCIRKYFPQGVEYTKPEGGMFLWVTLPFGLSSMELFNKAIPKNVAFVPGNPFYTELSDYYSTLRLNFSCADEDTIEIGIKRLGETIHELMIAKG